MTSAADALRKIADAGATFVSRGDGSGTEAKELGYWKKLEITPGPALVRPVRPGDGGDAPDRVGEGRLHADRHRHLGRDQVEPRSSSAMVDNDPSLLNIYHVIGVNPATWPKVNAAGAKAFSDYVLSADGQAIIGAFGQDTFGMQLFVPDAGKSESSLTTP